MPSPLHSKWVSRRTNNDKKWILGQNDQNTTAKWRVQVVQWVQEEYIKTEIAKIHAKQALLCSYVLFDTRL